MSTGQGCEFVEITDQHWWLLLEEQDHQGRNTGEWRAHGPFPSLDTADQHLREQFANPGTSSVTRFGEHPRPPHRQAIQDAVAEQRQEAVSAYKTDLAAHRLNNRIRR